MSQVKYILRDVYSSYFKLDLEYKTLKLRRTNEIIMHDIPKGGLIIANVDGELIEKIDELSSAKIWFSIIVNDIYVDPLTMITGYNNRNEQSMTIKTLGRALAKEIRHEA